MQKTSLVKRVRAQAPDQALMRDNRIWARINPALVVHMRWHVANNGGTISALVNLCIAEHFDREIAKRNRAAGGVKDG